MMFDGLAAHRAVGMRQGTKLVGMFLAGLILKRVGIDRVETEAQRLGLTGEGFRIDRLVPRYVKRNARCDAGEIVDDGGIEHFLRDIARLARDGKATEPRPALTE